ncbi:uncharacterized protein LOC144665012 [Oculina patagonica]
MKDSSNRQVRSRSTWPSGTYGLPKAKSGCPEGYFWLEGTRYHDSEDNRPNNHWSVHYDLDGGISKGNMEQKFCIKTQTTANYIPWPRGRYCIFKRGNCPHHFTEGFIYWDDEDYDNNNRHSGWLPDGHYGRNTKIYYCCRRDGYVTNPIKLPTDHPFVLLKAQNYPCQHVRGMYVREEWFYWDNEDKNGESGFGGRHPHVEYMWSNLKVHYCYYYK